VERRYPIENCKTKIRAEDKPISRLNPLGSHLRLLYLDSKRPAVFLLALYAALIPFDNVLGIGAGGTVTRYLGITVIIMMWVELLVKGQGWVFRPHRVIWGWLTFLVLAASSALWAIAPNETLSSLFTIGGLFLIYLSVAVSPFTGRDYSRITKAIIIGGVIAALVSLLGYLKGITYESSVRGSLILGGRRRADPNHFATSLILPLMFSLQWIFYTNRGRKILGLLAVSAIGLAILLSGSRGGVLGAAVATLLFFWRVRSQIRAHTIVKTIAYVFIAALIFAVYVAPPARLLDRFMPGVVLASGGTGRFSIWSVGWRAFLHRPIVGYGYNNFPYAYDLFRISFNSSGYSLTHAHMVAHNIYLQAFVELGLIGGLLLLFIVWQHWRLIRRLERRNSLAISLEAAFVGVMVTSATLGTLNYKYFWLLFTLVLMLRNATWRHKDAKR